MNNSLWTNLHLLICNLIFLFFVTLYIHLDPKTKEERTAVLTDMHKQWAEAQNDLEALAALKREINVDKETPLRERNESQRKAAVNAVTREVSRLVGYQFN